MRAMSDAPVINEIIAYNLAFARRLRGYTQQQAVERLNCYLTDEWSANTLSQAETSAQGKRVRHFTMEQVVAFARCYEVPIAFFLLPMERPTDDLDVTLRSALDPDELEALLVLADNPAAVDRVMRIRRWARQRHERTWRRFAERLVGRLAHEPKGGPSPAKKAHQLGVDVREEFDARIEAALAPLRERLARLAEMIGDDDDDDPGRFSRGRWQMGA